MKTGVEQAIKTNNKEENSKIHGNTKGTRNTHKLLRPEIKDNEGNQSIMSMKKLMEKVKLMGMILENKENNWKAKKSLWHHHRRGQY